MRRKTWSVALTMLLLPGLWVTILAEEYRGADAVLKQAAAASQKAVTPAPNFDSPVKLKHDLNVFEDKAATLDPAEAARQWLGLVDRFVSLPRDQESMSLFSNQIDDPQSN